MEGILDCLICKEAYDYNMKLPKILSCGHTLCKQCISYLQDYGRSVRCPLDRELEQRDLYHLPTNIALLQIQDFKNTGCKTKERCAVHWFPVTMICRTCNTHCCPKCIRAHRTHDLYDTEHPEILEDIANQIFLLEKKISDDFNQINDAQKRIQFEVDLLKEQGKELKSEITEYFSSLRNMVTAKENESLSQLDRKIQEKMNCLLSKQHKIDEEKSHYEEYIHKLHILKNEFSEKSFVDRSVTCLGLLKPFENLETPVMPELSNITSRIKLDCSQVFTSRLGDIQLKENCPLDLLIGKCASKMKKLSLSLNGHLVNNSEERLKVQVQSMSHYILALTHDLEMTEEHLLLEQISKIFGVKYKELDTQTQTKIPLSLAFNYKLFEEGLRNRVLFAYGIIEVVSLLRQKEWEKALKVLHILVIKFSDFELAELLMNALILRIAEHAKKIIKCIRIQETIYLLNLASIYLHYHLLPSHPVFKKFLKLISIILKENDDVLYGVQHRKILQSAQNIVSRLCAPCEIDISSEVPSCFQAEIDRLQKIRFKFWNNNQLPAILSLKMMEAKEELGVWWKTKYCTDDEHFKFEELAQLSSNI